MGFPARVETSRLVLRRPRAADAEAYFATFGDRDANTTNPRGYCADLAVATATIAGFVASWETRGFDIWAVCRDDLVIGFGGVGVRMFDDEPRLNLGYGLSRDAWGAGYAHEIAAASVAVARAASGFATLWARVQRDNAASRRVLARLGFAVTNDAPELSCRLELRGAA